MAAGGVAGADSGARGGGSTASSSKSEKADSYSKADRQAKANGKNSEKKSEQKAANGQNGREATVQEQGQKARDFDHVQGRPPVGEDPATKQQSKGDKESVFDIARRADKGAAGVVYDTAKEAIGLVSDAGGAVLDGAIGWTGVDAFEGHAERNRARGEDMWNAGKAVVGSPVETAKKGIETLKAEGAEALGEWEAGQYGDLAERGGKLVGAIAVGAVGGMATKALKRGDGPSAPKKADTPEGKPEIRTQKSGVEYSVTTDKPGWGETLRETSSLDEGRIRKQNSEDKGIKYEAKTLERLEKHEINIDERGVDIKDTGRKEMMPPPNEKRELGEIDIETKDHIIDVHSGKGGKREQMERQLNSPQLNRGKDVILYSPGYSRHGTEFIDGIEFIKDAIGPNGERARVIRSDAELADIIKSSR